MIAVTASERASVAADIPTTTEAGYPDIRIDGLTGVFGPRDMAAEVRERIAADVKAAAADPTITSRLLSTGQVVNPGGPSEFGAARTGRRDGRVARHQASGELGRALINGPLSAAGITRTRPQNPGDWGNCLRAGETVDSIPARRSIF